MFRLQTNNNVYSMMQDGRVFNSSPHTSQQKEMARLSNEAKVTEVQTVNINNAQEPKIDSVLKEKGRTLDMMG